MNATFEIKVNIDSKNVTTNIGTKGIDDLDTNLFAQILKVFSNVQKNVKAQVDKFYGFSDVQCDMATEGSGITSEEASSSENSDASQADVQDSPSPERSEDQ